MTTRCPGAMRSLFITLAVTVGIPEGLSQAQVDLPVVGKMPVRVQMHGSAIVGNRFYVFGGEVHQSGWSNDCHSAEISDGAQLQQWRREASLPARRAYLTNCVEVINGCIYTISALEAAEANTAESRLNRSADVLWTRIGQNGAVTRWNSSPFPGPPVSIGATCSTSSHLFFTGGTSKQAALAEVRVADIDSDGTPRNWRQVALMPDTRWYHSAAILGDRLYIWGGLPDRKADRPAAVSAVYSALINSDGSLNPWRSEAPMPEPVYSAGGCALNNYVVSVGGRYANAYPTNVIWTSYLDAGQIREWKMLPTNLQSRVYHSLAIDKERGLVFISGGRNKTAPGRESGDYLDVVQGFLLK